MYWYARVCGACFAEGPCIRWHLVQHFYGIHQPDARLLWPRTGHIVLLLGTEDVPGKFIFCEVEEEAKKELVKDKNHQISINNGENTTTKPMSKNISLMQQQQQITTKYQRRQRLNNDITRRTSTT
jgi:hypothetical protein